MSIVKLSSAYSFRCINDFLSYNYIHWPLLLNDSCHTMSLGVEPCGLSSSWRAICYLT